MTDTVTDVHDEPIGHHAVDRHYVNIAVALALITGVEVAVSYSGFPTAPLLTILLTLMAIKFFLVASQFMHLKFDPSILSRIFYGGLFLAVVVYMIALSTFRIWYR